MGVHQGPLLSSRGLFSSNSTPPEGKTFLSSLPAACGPDSGAHPYSMEPPRLLPLSLAPPLCLLLLLPLCSSDLSSHFVLEPYDFLFDSAVEAYSKGDWLSVILNMEKALRSKATVRRVKTQCRLSCANHTAFGDQLMGAAEPPPGSGALADLGFFQKILKRAECVKTCEYEKLGSPTLHEVTEDVELEFRKRTPYNYLQVAYFKVKANTTTAQTDALFNPSFHSRWGLYGPPHPPTQPCHVLRWSQPLWA